MASTVWKGYVSFGLISVPIRLFVAAREEHVSFNQIHKECGTRVKQQLYCPTDQRVVERSELAKGYQVDKDTYVLVTEDELKKILPAGLSIAGVNGPAQCVVSGPSAVHNATVSHSGSMRSSSAIGKTRSTPAPASFIETPEAFQNRVSSFT